jgi:hypothetical protein
MTTSSASTFCAIASAGLLVCSPAAGQSSDEWKFGAALYGYLPSVGGSSRFPPSGGGSSIDVDGDAILDNLDFAFFGQFEASRGRWGFFTDVMYVDISAGKSGSRGIAIGGALPADVAANVDYEVKGWVWSLAGMYRTISRPDYQLDLLFGARMLDVEQRLGWTLTGNVGPIPLPDRGGQREGDMQNWDAIVGVMGRAQLGGSRWFVPYYLDAGAGESKLTWQATAGIGYSFGWGDVVGAWRYLAYEMDGGKLVDDLNFNGPGIAAVFRW